MDTYENRKCTESLKWNPWVDYGKDLMQLTYLSFEYGCFMQPDPGSWIYPAFIQVNGLKCSYGSPSPRRPRLKEPGSLYPRRGSFRNVWFANPPVELSVPLKLSPAGRCNGNLLTLGNQPWISCHDYSHFFLTCLPSIFLFVSLS